MQLIWITLMSTAATIPLALSQQGAVVQAGPTADTTAITADDTTRTADEF